MRSKVLLFLVLSFPFFQIPHSQNVGAHAPEDWTVMLASDDHCDDPTLEIVIAATGPTSFDRDVIEVPKDTCITIWFWNVVEYPHNFVIEPVSGDSGIDAVYMDLENSTATCGQASSDHEDTPGRARFNIKTPNSDAEFLFYCAYEGHYEGGMHGLLIVGEGVPEDENGDSIVLFLGIGVIFLLIISYFRRPVA